MLSWGRVASDQVGRYRFNSVDPSSPVGQNEYD
jgi:protocatechuate 3,4-dioxygenase beta subunit